MRNDDFMDTVRSTAIPAAIAGAGLWMLIRNVVRDDDEITYQTAFDNAVAEKEPSRVQEMIGGSPLIAGVVALAVGALVGALIPETTKEHELLGSHRDKLAERAREMAREGVNRAKDMAGDAAHAATAAAKKAVKPATTSSSKRDTTRNIGVESSEA